MIELGASKELWATLIENGGHMRWSDAVAMSPHGGQILGPWVRDRFVARDEIADEVRLTDRGWRHVRYAYEYAVEHGYDGGT